MAKLNYGDQNGRDKPARKPKPVGEGWNAEFRGYINLNLSEEQKAPFEAWSQSASFWEALDFHTSDGVNLSLKYVPSEKCYLASATQRRETSPNAGLVVTARAGDAAKALGRVLFCLAILSHAARWEDVQPLASPDRW